MIRLLISGLSTGLAICILFASPVAVALSPSEPEDPDPPKVLDQLSGVWRLDWSQSESFGPAMKALEVPWLVRQMAGVIPVQITIEVAPLDCEICSPSLHIRSKNPIKNTSRVVMLDGIARPFTDVLGNDSMDLFSWHPEFGMEMVRERVLGSGKSAKIRERRTVTEDLSTMISTMTVWVEGEERASVRRILSKVDP